MDSFSSGEVLVVAVVALLALDPKSAGKWWAKFRVLRDRFMEARSVLEHEIRATLEDGSQTPETAQDRLRSWARDRVDAQDPADRIGASERLLARLRAWEGYATATDVAAFWSLPREVPMDSVLRAVLADGKKLWLPRVRPEAGWMDMVRVGDLETDLAEGKWKIREPTGPATDDVPDGTLVLIPGEIFDLHGSRIGKGGGYYDRWLARHPAGSRVGICWDAQVHPGKLPQDAHDQPIEHLLSPQRFVHFRGFDDRGRA
jgi:5-formyltetrahydrofolate cyclo-ligase